MHDRGPVHSFQRQLAETWSVRVGGEKVRCYLVDHGMIEVMHPDPVVVSRAVMVLSADLLGAGLRFTVSRVQSLTRRDPESRAWIMLDESTAIGCRQA